MSEKGTFTCDADGCEVHGGAWDGHHQPPIGFLTVVESGADPACFLPLHFCSWDCAIRYGASREPVEELPWRVEDERDD